MSIDILNKPKKLHPVYSNDNNFVFYNTTATGGVNIIYSETVIGSGGMVSSNVELVASVDYEIIITVNSKVKTFKVVPNLEGLCVFSPEYLLSNYITSRVSSSDMLFSYMTDGILPYTVEIKSYINGVLLSTDQVGAFNAYNGTSQPCSPIDINDYTPVVGGSVKWLNKTNGGIHVNMGDKLSLQAFIGDSGLLNGVSADLTSITLKEYYISNGVILSRNDTRLITTSPAFGIMSINISPSFWNIGDDVIYYDVITPNEILEVVRVNINTTNKLVKRRYRFSYVNSNGATDYATFGAADEESVTVRKSEYTNNGIRKVYNTAVDDEVAVLSNFITEDESFNLADLWVSPKTYIEVLKNYNDSTLYKCEVILNNKSIKILRDLELISYKASFSLIYNQNIQR